MRVAVLFAVCGLALGQPADPAYGPLSRAYAALKTRDYDKAVNQFLQAIDAAPQRAGIRKDLAYAYLKIGENELAREQFHQAMLLDPKDESVAMEYAFLCYESKEQAQARRIFDRIRKTGGANSRTTAEQAFQNIDGPLAAAIERWRKAIALGADTFDAHYELATVAEQRDDLALAAEHYQKAWLLKPGRRSVLLDLGRVWKALGRQEDANAALLAASRGGEPMAADIAREFLPARYPYVVEFRRALGIDASNRELRRELAYLLLSTGEKPDAETEFRILAEAEPPDLLAAAQLGYLLRERGDSGASALFDRVLAGPDEELARRVRNALHAQAPRARPDPPHAAYEAPPPPAAAPPTDGEPAPKVMGERSLKAGYLKDAARYFRAAHQADPADFEVMLKLAWSLNLLGQNAEAFRWFDEARKSRDPAVAMEAQQAWKNLRPRFETFRVTGWMYPLYSSRWRGGFGYGQLKMEIGAALPVHPYLSVRFVGDTIGSAGRLVNGAPMPQLSESAVIAAAGLATNPWHRFVAWAEAGSSIGYLNGHALPDYRGGVSASRGAGHLLRSESPGPFADTAFDVIFVSRFDNDVLVYSQSRFGYTFGPRSLRGQLYWNANVNVDNRREAWSNFAETGPGLRFRAGFLPQSMYFTVDAVHGVYIFRTIPAHRPNFNDIRAGLWYAFTR